MPPGVSSTKPKSKAESRVITRSKKLFLVFIPAVLIVTAALLGAYFLFNSASSVLPKAAIIDQVSSSQLTASSRHVNQTLVEIEESLLQTRFSSVDYYSDNATVDFYRLLPSKGYKLIVWSAHSALDEQSSFVAISSSENNESKNYDQYTSEELTMCNITGDPRLYFAITPTFVKDRMEGRFDDTIIILMTCNGLKDGYYSTADALLEKGAKVIISWDGWVTFSDNDAATLNLLRYLTVQNDTISDAVKRIPTYTSEFGSTKLNYFPYDVSVESYHVPDYRRTSSNLPLTLAVAPVKRKARLVPDQLISG